MAITDAFTDIHSYIQNGDNELALRRILDAAYDTNNLSLIEDTVVASKKIRPLLDSGPVIVAEQLNDAIEKIKNANPGIALQRKDEVVLTTYDIQKTYRTGRFSLSALSMQVQAGEVLGIVGENGNGKTTLLRMLAGELASDQGTIVYNAFPKADQFSEKQQLAFIPQRIPRWYGGLKDNLHFTAAIAGLQPKENKIMVNFMLERFNLSAYADLTWDKISSGYRTRFEIARVLLQNPKILILDEPLANLDIKAQQTLLTDLVFLSKGSRRNMGVLLSSQQLHEVEKVADHVLFVKNGKSFLNNALTQTSISYMIEVECAGERQDLQNTVKDEDLSIAFNGGFYTITSSSINSSEMLQMLLHKGWKISYYRDITHSTKRYFN